MDKYAKYAKFIEFSNSTLNDDHKKFIDRDDPHLLNDARIAFWTFVNNKWTKLYRAFRINGGETIFPYLKSCEYTEKVVQESNELFDKKIQELVLENQELKSLVYNLLDRIKQLENCEVKPVEEIVPGIQAQESVSRKPVQNSLDDLDDEEESTKNNPLLAAERRGQIKRGGTVANAVNSFKKNFYDLKDDARQAQMVRDWQS
jgi:hypothetical protein